MSHLSEHCVLCAFGHVGCFGEQLVANNVSRQSVKTKALADDEFHLRSCFNFILCPTSSQKIMREIPTDMKVMRITFPGQKFRWRRTVYKSSLIVEPYHNVESSSFLQWLLC